MLILLVGTGVYMSIRLGFLQFGKFGYVMRNTVGKMFRKSTAGHGEITPMQALTTALAATIGTGNIAGVTGAIFIGGPGAVFWMWIAALFGMLTKYSEVVLAVKYRERNEAGDWVGGPMYYIKNGMGEKWKWLGGLFCVLAALAALGIGNATQVQSIADAVNSAIDSFGGNTSGVMLTVLGSTFKLSTLIVAFIIAAIVALVLVGGIKRIGKVTEKLVPFMAVVYILAGLIVIIANIRYVPQSLAMIVKGAFNARAAIGGSVGGITILLSMQKGVGRGCFSNEAGLGSAPMAHAATSETDPVNQGLYGVFEVFMDTIVICTFTSLIVITSHCSGGINISWGAGGGASDVSAAMGSILGGKAGSLVVACCLTLFALSTVLSWSLYGSRCVEYLLGGKAAKIYTYFFIAFILVGATISMEDAWTMADALNGFMAVPNLIALLSLSGVTVRCTREHFAIEKAKNR